MKSPIIDLRSDTVTLPSSEMKRIMFDSELGDDVFGEDPSINSLEEYIGNLFGMDWAIFVPSGTMSNQIAIKLHTQPGDDIICDYFSHIYQYEGGGIGLNSGCSVSLIHSESGQFSAQDVEKHIHPEDVHKPVSRLVSIENTCNKGGGSTWEMSDLEEIKDVCTQNGLSLHLDGARLFNALVAKNQNPKDYGQIFDTISICLSKGLGAPVGSVLIGNGNNEFKARRFRKIFGGGMRQAGFLASAGLFALKNNVNRLAEDHLRAKEIKETLSHLSWVNHIVPVETNIVIFSVTVDENEVIDKLKEKNILISKMGPGQLRMVTHLNISEAMYTDLKQSLTNLY